MPNLFLTLDVQCSMLDVRRFRADLWMKSFLKYWLPVLGWLVVTFIGSTNVMSVEQTSPFIVPFLLWLKPGMTPQTIWVIVVFMRHCAHVGEYAVLALLMWRALRSVPRPPHKNLMVFGAVSTGVRPVCRKRRISPIVR